MGIVVEAMKQFRRPDVPTSGLVLYYHPNNFFSQKIMIALYEKQLPFTAQLIDITKGEQYSAWFLELNPRGEVPVLRNGVQIIPESNRILKYLEDHFSEDKYPKLFPKDENDEIFQQIIRFNNKISRLPIGPITMGVIVHSDLRQHSKPPLDNVTLDSVLETNREARKVLFEYAQIDPAHAKTLIQRSNMQLEKLTDMKSRDEFMLLVNSVHAVLQEIEEHLGNTNFGPSNDTENTDWLLNDSYTIADLSLTVLLHRLSSLGLEQLFWKPDRPLIGLYYDRVCARESFLKTLPAPRNLPKSLEMLMARLTPIQIASVVTVISGLILLVPCFAMTTK